MSAQPIKILLIEDNPHFAELIGECLAGAESSSFTLEWVDRLSAGLQRLVMPGIDVVLLDLGLPDSKGLDALVKTLAQAPTVPIIILTGQQEDLLGTEALRKGAQDFLIKGYLDGVLIARSIRYAIERFRVWEQLRQQEAHLRLLTSQLPAILWTTDCELRFTSSLGLGLRDLGLEPGQVIGLTLSEFFKSSEIDAPVLDAHRRGLQGEAVHFELEWMKRSYFAHVEPLRYGSNQILGTIGVALDVTNHRHLEEELRIARRIHQGLLPRSIPAFLGLDIAGASHPVKAIGGDYYDFITMRDGNMGIVIGDVSGHGFGSALLMGSTRAYLRALARVHTDVSEVLAFANELVAGDIHESYFVTLFMACFEPQTLAFRYASAGHTPGFVLSSAGTVKHCLRSTGLPLGVLPTGDFPSSDRIVLDTGDIVVLLTDGVSEAFSPDGVIFGHERALDVVREHAGCTAGQIVEALYQAVVTFSHGTPQHDDISAVVIKAVAN